MNQILKDETIWCKYCGHKEKCKEKTHLALQNCVGYVKTRFDGSIPDDIDAPGIDGVPE